jgi:hypothetical protein
MSWNKLLEAASESLNDHVRLRNDYLMAENHILRHQIEGRVQLTDSERKELAALGVQLGKKTLSEIATLAKPETILAWNRKFANQNVPASKAPPSVGRLRVDQEIGDWVIRMARENRSWGYDRIQGALNHLGYTISDQTVGNILKRHGISPAPECKTTVTWREFIRSHWDVLMATGFFSSEVWNYFGQSLSLLLSIILSSARRRPIRDGPARRVQPANELLQADEADALRRPLRRLGYDLAVAFNTVPSILAYTQQEWERRKRSGSPFREAVERDAVSVL